MFVLATSGFNVESFALFRQGVIKGKRESGMGVRNGEHNLISVAGTICVIFNIAGYDSV
jgi:hypothetical protein